jgi:hypothetical protein
MENEDLALKIVGKDADGAPIYEVDGITYTYRGKDDDGNMVWQSEMTSAQLVWLAPDFAEVEHRLPNVQ